MAWNLSCADWADRIRNGRSLVPELPLNRTEADRAVEIFNRLRLPDVRGTPALREAGADWFREIVAALFGSIDAEIGARRIRGLFILAVAKLPSFFVAERSRAAVAFRESQNPR